MLMGMLAATALTDMRMTTDARQAHVPFIHHRDTENTEIMMSCNRKNSVDSVVKLV
jgi:hypothetical protein